MNLVSKEMNRGLSCCKKEGKESAGRTGFGKVEKTVKRRAMAARIKQQRGVQQ